MLFAVYLGEDFIDVERIAVTTVLTLQMPRIYRAEFDAPKVNGFVADLDPAFSQQIFDIAVTGVESIVEPDGVTDDIWRESVTFVSIHPPILTILAT
jgi:hypothetical protein